MAQSEQAFYGHCGPRLIVDNNSPLHTRSSSTFCHESYDILGDAVESACHHCCLEEEAGEAKAVGPGPVVNPDIEKTAECHVPENTAINRYYRKGVRV